MSVLHTPPRGVACDDAAATLFLDLRAVPGDYRLAEPAPEPAPAATTNTRVSDANWLRLNLALLQAGVPPTASDSRTLAHLAQADPAVVDTVISWIRSARPAAPRPADPRLSY